MRFKDQSWWLICLLSLFSIGTFNYFSITHLNCGLIWLVINVLLLIVKIVAIFHCTTAFYFDEVQNEWNSGRHSTLHTNANTAHCWTNDVNYCSVDVWLLIYSKVAGSGWLYGVEMDKRLRNRKTVNKKHKSISRIIKKDIDWQKWIIMSSNAATERESWKDCQSLKQFLLIVQSNIRNFIQSSVWDGKENGEWNVGKHRCTGRFIVATNCIPPRLSVIFNSGVEYCSRNYDFIILRSFVPRWMDGKYRVKGREVFFKSLSFSLDPSLCMKQKQLYETLTEPTTSHNNHGGR